MRPHGLGANAGAKHYWLALSDARTLFQVPALAGLVAVFVPLRRASAGSALLETSINCIFLSPRPFDALRIDRAVARAGAQLFRCISKLQKIGYRLSMETPFGVPVRHCL